MSNFGGTFLYFKEDIYPKVKAKFCFKMLMFKSADAPVLISYFTCIPQYR